MSAAGLTSAVIVLVLSGVVLSGGSGCGDGDPALMRCPLGDPAAPVELEIIHLDGDFNLFTTTPNAEVPLVAPPQGGWILQLGARATNLDGCQLTLTVSFRDPCNADIIKVDRRPSQLMPTSDGWGVTTASTIGNLPVCPQVTSLRNLHDQPYVVTVTLEDIDGKEASREITVIPVCPGDVCACQCDKNYVLGDECPVTGPDAGVGC